MFRNVVGLFKSRNAAQDAQRDLHSAGYSNDTVTVIDKDSDHLDRVFTGAGMQSADTQLYRDGIRRGKAVVLARSENGANIEQAGNVFQRYQPVDVERRRQELTDSGVITVPVVEEELRVGKRVVERGGIRVFVHVETIPVEVPVTLRDETVTVEHRPVNQTVANPDAILCQQSVEMVEVDEEPVVEKRAVVKEEVVIKKTAQERTETVQDVVRRTDVHVDDLSAGTSTTESNTRDRGTL